MSRHCDGTGQKLPCPHPDDCTVSCMFNDATETRKIKPYPAVPDDIEPVPNEWRSAGAVMLTCIFGVLGFICLVLFFTGVWLWGILV